MLNTTTSHPNINSVTHLRVDASISQSNRILFSVYLNHPHELHTNHKTHKIVNNKYSSGN